MTENSQTHLIKKRLSSHLRDHAPYWIKKALVYGVTALLGVLAILYAIHQPYETETDKVPPAVTQRQ